LDPDSVRERSSGVSVPDEPRLEREIREVDAEDDDGRRRSRSLLVLLRRLGDDDVVSSSPGTAPPVTQQSRDFHGGDEPIVVTWRWIANSLNSSRMWLLRKRSLCVCVCV
jgi:hypothetical protein